jgi:hypothetical protein
MMWRRWPILVAALGLLLAACGSGDGAEGIASLQEDTAAGDGSTTTAPAAATDPEQAMLDFTQCMRDHGIDMPDPEVNTAGGGFSFGITVQGGPGDAGGPNEAEMQKMQEADAACRHFLEGMVQQFEQPDMTEMQDQMLAFSQCMRDHGVDYPDPVFSEDGGVTLIGPDEGAAGLDPSDPAFQAAQEACQEIFGGNGPITITGGGAGVIVGPGGATSGVVTPPPAGAVPAPDTDGQP